MTTIPERIREEAQRIAELANECCYRMDGYEENIREQIEQALLAAEKQGREEAAKQMAELKEERDHLLEIGSKAVKFQLGDVFVESRGLGIWAVCNGGCVRNVLGEWEYEPFPSGRDDEFIARTRFPFAEAWEIASAIRSTN
jgi:hypothetical protein